MQVLLRTASTFARQCGETAQQIEVRPTIRMSVHQNYPVEQRLNDAATTTYANIEDVLELHAVRATLRRLIGHTNDESVNELLAEKDMLNQDEKYLTGLIEQIVGKENERSSRRRMYGLDAGSGPRTEHDTSEVDRALEAIRQRMATVTTGDVADYVEVPALNKDQVKKLQARVAAIRRRRSVVSDKLAAENLRLHVTLPPEVERVLRKHDIIA